MNSSNFKLVLILALIFITTVFSGQNIQIININVLVWTYYMSVSIVIISMLIVGVLFGWFLKSYVNHQNKKVLVKDKIINPD
ncbi:MAG: LapA family protein [Bacteroidetes bacterium]|nr:LapA family protein [Bacteroidota bacterium]MBU1798414.1 LapA family protein [Bacteroidota bacterium]